ncbi:MAG: hypothetical protein R3E96_09810 [Planctomycetota bacterium]
MPQLFQQAAQNLGSGPVLTRAAARGLPVRSIGAIEEPGRLGRSDDAAALDQWKAALQASQEAKRCARAHGRRREGGTRRPLIGRRDPSDRRRLGKPGAPA